MITEQDKKILSKTPIEDEATRNDLFDLFVEAFQRQESIMTAMLTIYHYGRIEGIRAERRKKKGKTV